MSTVLAFYVGGVSAATPASANSSIFAHVVVGTPLANGTGQVAVHTVGELGQRGDTAFGMLSNDWLNFGWMSCNTPVGGTTVYADAEGRTLPLALAGKHIEIKVDCGTTFSGFNRVATTFIASDMDASGNKGAELWKYDGIMNIWSGRLSSDVEVAGRLTPITGASRLPVGTQVLNCEARNH